MTGVQTCALPISEVVVVGKWDESADPKDFVPQTELDKAKAALEAANAELAALKSGAKAEAEAAKKSKAQADAKAKAEAEAAKQ